VQKKGDSLLHRVELSWMCIERYQEVTDFSTKI
jgi:hypothetical protein